MYLLQTLFKCIRFSFFIFIFLMDFTSFCKHLPIRPNFLKLKLSFFVFCDFTFPELFMIPRKFNQILVLFSGVNYGTVTSEFKEF